MSNIIGLPYDPNLRVTYQISANKQYNYDSNVLATTPCVLSINFFANTADPEEAGLVPYYKSSIGSNDTFFQSLISKGYIFNHSNIAPNFKESGGNDYSTWSENYTKVAQLELGTKKYFDVSLRISVPSWRLVFADFVNFNNEYESRRLRQAYGFTPLNGSFSAKSKTDPGTDFKNWFIAGTDFSKFIIENASYTDAYENNERVYTIEVSFKTYDLTEIPRFWE